MIVKVLVKPGSKKGPLVVEDEEGLTVFLREKAHDGEANAALIEILADYFNVSKTCVEIKKGGKTRRKTVEVFSFLPKNENM
ncbi:MAG: DUF167 domain-containing protein [Candidatus Saccharibacteria bacterium]|nr:DUF167 domain-containing protein [Candidatus Saccharibacteria bacterium]